MVLNGTYMLQDATQLQMDQTRVGISGHSWHVNTRERATGYEICFGLQEHAPHWEVTVSTIQKNTDAVEHNDQNNSTDSIYRLTNYVISEQSRHSHQFIY